MQLVRSAWARTAIAAALVAIVTAFAGQRLASGASELDGRTFTDNLPWFGAAIGVLMLAALLLAAAWIVLLEDVVPRPTRRRVLIVSFAYAWMGRYVPGTIPFFAGKVYLGAQAGYPTRPLLLATAVQNVLEILVATVVGATMIVFALGVDERGGLFALLALAPLAGLLALHPRALRIAVDASLRILRRDPIEEGSLPGGRALLGAACFVAMNQVLNGAALWLVLHPVADADVSTWALATGAMSLAGVAGILVVLVPAGFGVRDSVLAAFLAPRFTVQAAALASVIFRLLTVIADLALFLLALAVDVAAGWSVATGAMRGDRGDRTPTPLPTAPAGAAIPERRSA